MKNKIIPLLSLTKRDYKPKRILSQPKPVSIIPTKTYNNELTEIYNSLYEDFFPLILKLTKNSFFDKMDKKVKEIIFSGNTQKDIEISTNLQLVSKIKEDLSKKYDNQYKFLSREYQNYIKNNKKYNYLSHFRKHCAQTENIGLHYCSDKKRGKFIEIKTKNRLNKEETSYVICAECKQCYPSDFILMICVSCNKKFFSNILDEKEDINILPATWQKYHCGSMINEIMKCIKCHQTLYIDLITKKLVCKNKRCNFVSKPESILWKCFICTKDFRSGAKIYNPLEFRILKKAIKFALLLKKKAAPKELPCGCEKDISKLTFYHKEQCRGELYQGLLIDKEIIVCSKCHSINFEEKYNWICPICSAKFHLHSVIGCKPFSKKKYVINRYYNKSAKNIISIKHNKENKEKNMNNINIYNAKESEIERLAKDLNPYNSKNPITEDLKNPILKRPHTFCEKYNEDVNKNLISLKKPKHTTNIIVRKKKHYSTLIEILQKRQSDSRNNRKDIKKNKNEKESEKTNRKNYETQDINNNIIKKKKESQYNKYKIFGQQKYLETENLRGNKKYYKNNSRIMNENNNINISINKNIDKEKEIFKTEKKIKVRTRFHCKLSPFNGDEELKDENKNKENKENKEILRNAESTDFSSYKTLSSHGNIKYNKNNLFNNLSNINNNRPINPLNSFRHKNKNSFTDNNDSKGTEFLRFSKLNEQQTETSYQDTINDLKFSSKKRMETDNSSIRYSLLESNSKLNEPYDYSNKKSSNFKNDKVKKIEELQEASKFSYKSPKNKHKKNLYTNIYTEVYRNTEENICDDDEFNIKKDEDEDEKDNDKEANGKIDRDEIDVKIDKDESSKESDNIVRKETNGKIDEDDLDVKIDDDDEKDSISKIEEDINNNINKHIFRKETQGKIVYSDGEDSIDKEQENKEPIYPAYQRENMHKIHENKEDEDDSMDKNQEKIDNNEENERSVILYSEKSESSSQINEKEENNKSEKSEDSQKSENDDDDELEDKVEIIPYLPMSKKNVRESFVLNTDFISQSVLISQEKLNSLASQTTIPTINESDYSLIKSIGEGTYGVVYLVENNETLEQFALKKIVCRDYNELIKHKNELELIFSVKHENILSLYGLQYKYLDETTSAIYVLMELAQNDWNKEIKRRMIAKKYYKEYEIVEILKQIIKGFLFLQDKDISHRDIKPQNILLFPNNVYKIADFGEAKNIKNIAQQSTLRGSELYMSPVLYKGYKFNQKNVMHNPYKSDVFSLGYCLVYAMCLNLNVLESLRELTTMRSIIACIDKHIVHHLYSDKLMNLIYKMIEPNEDQRIDFEDLMEELNKNFK